MALLLHFPTLPPVMLEMNVAKMVALLPLACGWNNRLGDIQNVTGMFFPVKRGGGG